MRDLTGYQFGELTVLGKADFKQGSHTLWRCQCSCGAITLVNVSNLTCSCSRRCNDWKKHPRKKRLPTNQYTIIGNIVKVSCANGCMFSIDVDDYEFVKKHGWFVNRGGYAYTTIGGKRYALHRLLIGADEGYDVDHISGDNSDNRKSNLRICHHAENQRNRKLTSTNQIGYKGVNIPNGRKRFVAQVRLNDKTIYLGSYETAKEAAAAYDRAAVLYHGEFAKTNSMLGLMEN